MSDVRKSLFIYFSASNVITLLEFGSSLVLARLLTPAEIGVYSVAAVLVGIVYPLRSLGTGSYVVQETELTEARLRSAFGLVLLTSWGIGLAIVLASATIAEFYREPGVRQVMLVLALNMVLVPFGSITMAHLARDMRFGALSRIDICASASNLAASVALAFAGYGYMSMAWGATAGIAVTIAGARWYRPKGLPWLPGFSELRRVLAFGTYTTGTDFIRTVGAGAPDIILGRMLNVEAVGLFGRALSVVRMFGRVTGRAIGAVALPYFSQQHRDGADLKAGFLKSASYMAGAAWPFFAVLAILAHPVVRLLYGAQWDASIPLVRVLCASVAIGAPFSLMGAVVVAAGRPKYMLFAEAAALPVRVAVIIVAAPWGLGAVAISFIVSSIFHVAINLAVLRTTIGLRVLEMLGAVWRSGGVAALAAVGPALVWWSVPLDGWRPWIVLAAGLPAGLAGWLLGLVVLRHPLWDELTAASIRLWRRIR